MITATCVKHSRQMSTSPFNKDIWFCRECTFTDPSDKGIRIEIVKDKANQE